MGVLRALGVAPGCGALRAVHVAVVVSWLSLMAVSFLVLLDVFTGDGWLAGAPVETWWWAVIAATGATLLGLAVWCWEDRALSRQEREKVRPVA